MVGHFECCADSALTPSCPSLPLPLPSPPQVPISRIAALNRPELPAAFTGLAGSAALGMMMPAFAIAFSSILGVFYGPIDEISSGAQKWSLVFVGIGCGAIVAALFQVGVCPLRSMRCLHSLSCLKMTACVQ